MISAAHPHIRRVDRTVAPSTPHRPRRADFPHSALQNTGSPLIGNSEATIGVGVGVGIGIDPRGALRSAFMHRITSLPELRLHRWGSAVFFVLSIPIPIATPTPIILCDIANIRCGSTTLELLQVFFIDVGVKTRFLSNSGRVVSSIERTPVFHQYSISDRLVRDRRVLYTAQAWLAGSR